MSTPTDLMGCGIPAAAASRLGNAPLAVTATGTSSGAAKLLTGGHVYHVSSATSQTGVILNSVESIGEVIFISCDSASSASAVVYPPSGATISGASSVTLAANKGMIVWKYSATLFWHVILP